MTPEQFCYWLQGYLELSNAKDLELDKHQVKCIQDHLDLVLNKVTPDRKKNIPAWPRAGVISNQKLC